MYKDSYKFYLDVSGTLRDSKDDLYIGAILFNDRFKTGFREQFYREFPTLQSFGKKGTGLGEDKLNEILQFMNQHHVKMSVVELSRHAINKAYVQAQIRTKESKKLDHVKVGDISVKDFYERIMGLSYFKVMEPHAIKHYPYDCFCCQETQYQMQPCLVALQRRSFKSSFNFRTAMIPRRTEHMIKFADFTASAGRKLDKFVLRRFENFKIIKYTPTDYDIDVAFCLDRHK